MLLRFTLGAAGAMVLASTATAQNVSGNLQPITSPVKDAGTYHMATGTWTRAKTSVALAGPEVIYDNTCTTGYFIGMDPNEVQGDSGRIPSTSSGGGTGSTVTAGAYDDYSVNGFEIAYCSYESAPITIFNPYWDCYSACLAGGSLSALTPVAAFSLVSLPAGTPTGGQGCWLVTFDLMNTTFAFNLQGDCNGTYDNNASTDSFGWGFGTPAVLNGTTGTGPFLAGDPALAFNPSCGGVGDGTTFAGALAGPGTGIGQIDQFELQSLTVSPGCYWFGGYSGANGAGGPGLNPFSGFYMQLQGDERVTGGDPGASDCDCDGGNSPCVNFSGVGRGCPNSNSALGAMLVGSGSPSIGGDTFGLTTVDAAASKPGLILSGTNSFGPDGLAGVANNAGLLCVGGQTRRGAVVFTDVNGAASFPTFQGGAYGASDIVSAGSSVSYSHWFRDPGTASGCLNDGPEGDFNFTNGWTAMWTL